MNDNFDPKPAPRWRAPLIAALAGAVLAGGVVGAVSSTTVTKITAERDDLAAQLEAVTDERDTAVSTIQARDARADSEDATIRARVAAVEEREAAADERETELAALAEAIRSAERDSGTASLDLTTDAGICAADAEMTNLELNDALAPLLGYPADRDSRTDEQAEAIREHKSAAVLRECPGRAS